MFTYELLQKLDYPEKCVQGDRRTQNVTVSEMFERTRHYLKFEYIWAEEGLSLLCMTNTGGKLRPL